MAIVSESILKAELTEAQTHALRELYCRSSDGNRSLDDFIHTAIPELGSTGCILVHWCGMTVGIESDGYRHT